MLSPRRTNRMLLIILAAYLMLATAYNVSTPLFEAPDENHHFFTARFIARQGVLPTVSTGGELARQEAAQPPLYYLLAAPLVALFDTDGMEMQLWRNSSAINGEARPINVNNFVHTEAEAWPWQGYALAGHLVRTLSTVIGLGTLLAIFGAGRLLWPRAPGVALLATALVALLPQFGFLHGAITNDVLIIFLSSAVLWQMLRLWISGISSVRLLLLGVTVGLAILTKMAGLLLLALALLVLLLLAWRDRSSESLRAWMTPLVGQALLVGVPALLIGGWLLWRNWTLYGDPTAVNQFITLAGKNRQWTLRQVWGDMDRVAMSAVAYFGWMNVQAPNWLYAIWVAILSLSGGGWLLAVWRRRGDGAPPGSDNRLPALWLALWVALVLIGWLRFMMQTPADQGRLLFPALLPVALATARGLSQWRQPGIQLVAIGGALVTTLYGLLVLLPGAYRPAQLIEAGDIPPDAAWPALEMSPGIELLAVEPRTDLVRPGEWVWVDLYWRASDAPEEALVQGLGLYGRDHDLVGAGRYFHGGGTYPATLWPADQVIKDRVGVQLFPDAELPAQLRLLLRIDDSYEPVEIARVKALPAAWPEVDAEPLAIFGSGIELLSLSLSETETQPGSYVDVTAKWQVGETPGRELTTFVHLGDPAQAPLAQADGPAVGGDYPVSLWAAGELVDDAYQLQLPPDLPPGTYPVHIGFYDPQTGARLPVVVAEERQTLDAYYAGSITVSGE